MSDRVNAQEAQELIAAGALVIDVLPTSPYRGEHLPVGRGRSSSPPASGAAPSSPAGVVTA